MLVNLLYFLRVNKQTGEFLHGPANTRSAKRPETIPEEPEPAVDPFQEKWASSGTQRPGSPQRPTSPQRPPSTSKSPAQQRPSTSPQRAFSSPSGQPVPFVGQRPDSEPQARGSRPYSPSSSSDCSMSPTLLEIPPFQLSEKVEQLTQDEVRGLCFLLTCVAGIRSFRSKVNSPNVFIRGVIKLKLGKN